MRDTQRWHQDKQMRTIFYANGECIECVHIRRTHCTHAHNYIITMSSAKHTIKSHFRRTIEQQQRKSVQWIRGAYKIVSLINWPIRTSRRDRTLQLTMSHPHRPFAFHTADNMWRSVFHAVQLNYIGAGKTKVHHWWNGRRRTGHKKHRFKHFLFIFKIAAYAKCRQKKNGIKYETKCV